MNKFISISGMIKNWNITKSQENIFAKKKEFLVNVEKVFEIKLSPKLFQTLKFTNYFQIIARKKNGLTNESVRVKEKKKETYTELNK